MNKVRFVDREDLHVDDTLLGESSRERGERKGTTNNETTRVQGEEFAASDVRDYRAIERGKRGKKRKRGSSRYEASSRSRDAAVILNDETTHLIVPDDYIYILPRFRAFSTFQLQARGIRSAKIQKPGDDRETTAPGTRFKRLPDFHLLAAIPPPCFSILLLRRTAYMCFWIY